MKGLRYLQDPIGFTALAKALGSTDAMLRATAAWALSVAGAPQAEQELIRALNEGLVIILADSHFKNDNRRRSSRLVSSLPALST